MSFRRRVVLLSATGVAAAIVIASVLVYVLTSHQLSGQVDQSLRERLLPGPQAVRVQSAVRREKLDALVREGKLPPWFAQGFQSSSASARVAGAAGGAGTVPLSGGAAASVGGVGTLGQSGSGTKGSSGAKGSAGRERNSTAVRTGSGSSAPLLVERAVSGRGGHAALPAAPGEVSRLVLPHKGLGPDAGYVQLTQSDGKVLRSEDKGTVLPLNASVRAVAAGHHGPYFTNVTIDSTPMRVLVERAGVGAVWQIALPLTEMNSTLGRLRLVLAIVSLGGVLLACALGLAISRAAVRPVRRLTRAAERVARTQDLGHRIHVGGEDELGRLSASFNTMLGALERSRLAQRQLISDASHELRTPLTSIQANLDALALGERLPGKERARVLAAAQAQLRELSVLVGDLVDLSKTEFDELELEDVRLDLAAGSALERARLHAPDCRFELDAEPCLVRAAPARLDRAITNLLDNAVKWGPPQGPVQVRVRDGAIEVRDHGPGIDPADLPRVFDRFYRAVAARSRPGSGLGLAIVRQVAETLGGSVHADNHPDGGAVLTLELPPLSIAEDEERGGGGAAAGEIRAALHDAPRSV